MGGGELRGAAVDALAPLEGYADSEEVRDAIHRAVELADAPGEPSAETIERLGAGFIAAETVSIAVYCALVARDFEHGLRLAANLSGDSDSTASITGQLLGVIGGEAVLPKRWREALELHEVIEQVGRDLALVRADRFDAEVEWERYPG